MKEFLIAVLILSVLMILYIKALTMSVTTWWILVILTVVIYGCILIRAKTKK